MNHIRFPGPARAPEGRSPLGLSLDILEAICKAGLALAPMEPSEAMRVAGSRAGGVSESTAGKVYRAMIAAVD